MLLVDEVGEPVRCADPPEQVTGEGRAQPFRAQAIRRVDPQGRGREGRHDVVDVRAQARRQGRGVRPVVGTASRAVDGHADDRAVEHRVVARGPDPDDHPGHVGEGHRSVRGNRAVGRRRLRVRGLHGRRRVGPWRLQPRILLELGGPGVLGILHGVLAVGTDPPPQLGEALPHAGLPAGPGERVRGRVGPPAGDGVAGLAAVEAVRGHLDAGQVEERVVEGEPVDRAHVGRRPHQAAAGRAVEHLERHSAVERRCARRDAPGIRGQRRDAAGDRVQDPPRGVCRAHTFREQRADHDPTVRESGHPDLLGDRVVLAAQQRVRQRPVEVHPRRPHRAGVKGCRVPVDTSDVDAQLLSTGGHDIGLDVDRHEDPLVADQVLVPRLPRGEVDVGTGERGEAIGVDALCEPLGSQVEVGHHTPPSLNVSLTCLA